MSLVGSLEDLGLGDILQIVSLARKSGRLLLRTNGHSGRIVVSDGMVRGAAIKGELEDLHGLLVAGGRVSAEAFERAREVAAQGGMPLEDALSSVAGLPREQLDALRREQVEQAVMRMFTWRSGEFSFEVCEEPASEDLHLLLPTGINTQYLAMEATRLRDEGDLVDDPFAGDAGDDAAPMFSGESPEPERPQPDLPLAAAVDAVALAAARDAVPAECDEDDDTEPGFGPAAPGAVDVEQSDAAAPIEVRVDVVVPERAVACAPQATPPLVAIDRNLTGLEWLKSCVSEEFRVHIFQHEEAGMDRIRRYLARGVVPLVALAPSRAGESGGHEALRRRMRMLASEMPVLALLAGDDAAVPAGFDGALIRPVGLVSDPEQWEPHEELAERLRDDLRAALRRSQVQPATSRRTRSEVLADLRAVSDRLRDPLRRDDVLSVVLEFAAHDFSRIAMFMVRDDVAVGMAQRGMAAAGGPDDAGMRRIQLRREELPPLFEKALTTRSGAQGMLSGSAGSRLAGLLGGLAPREAYTAPIESGGCVAALLYADQLPADAPIGDTTALEIVLHEAGLALDRALLERALADAQAGDAAPGS